jgi:hypothetical protein
MGLLNGSLGFPILHNLPLVNQRSLVLSKINLIPCAVRVAIEDCFDDGIDDLAAVHVDADFVANLKLAWELVGLFWHGGIVHNRARSVAQKSSAFLLSRRVVLLSGPQ